ncbi:MAG: hypothetical protein KF713_17950 [Turneriella sp.]|nr:hypothetical protein [Turneriella sp.]
MPEGLRSIAEFVARYRVFFIAGGIAFALFLTALITLIVALKRARRMRGISSVDKKATAHKGTSPVAEAAPPAEAPRVKRAKLSIGDAPSPWTQGIYEQHSPEGKIEALLPAFAFDEADRIHRVQMPDAVQGADFLSAVRHCDTAAGLAVNGAYATLLLWHSGDPSYAQMALKVASHGQIVPEQKELIRFLFQDVTGKPLSPRAVPGLTRWSKPAFKAAVALYNSPRISPQQWNDLEKVLPVEFKRFYELELAQKLPAKTIYRDAATSPVFSEGLYRTNLKTLRRYMSPARWLRLRNSGYATRFSGWLSTIPCETEADALLHVANPDVFEKEDLPEELAAKIQQIFATTNIQAWLFENGKKPPLTYRLHYFKFFCLFERYNEAVRCFAFLGIFRRDRATRLYYARALFAVRMEHDAWIEMSSLMSDYPRDAAVLNEAAIYAHKLGRHEEAAEIFALARGMYPDDATLAYNEAVFTEQFSQIQIQEKWSAVQKMNSWSEPQRVTTPPVID